MCCWIINRFEQRDINFFTVWEVESFQKYIRKSWISPGCSNWYSGDCQKPILCLKESAGCVYSRGIKLWNLGLSGFSPKKKRKHQRNQKHEKKIAEWQKTAINLCSLHSRGHDLLRSAETGLHSTLRCLFQFCILQPLLHLTPLPPSRSPNIHPPTV